MLIYGISCPEVSNDGGINSKITSTAQEKAILNVTRHINTAMASNKSNKCSNLDAAWVQQEWHIEISINVMKVAIYHTVKLANTLYSTPITLYEWY